MNLEELKNKTILLFGKSRAFSQEEFDYQMRYHEINVVKEYTDELAFSIDGRMMTPYEQNASDALYENKNIPSMSIDLLEKNLAKTIDEDTLLMSLKLSHDKGRLKSFLQNSTITDSLFLRLVQLYNYSNEDFFENDDNRDVTAAFISRFYENIERNHNVQYATTGLIHLVLQAKEAKLIEVIFSLEPLQKALKKDRTDVNYKIITAITTHNLTPLSVLKTLIKKSNAYVKMLIAMRSDCDMLMQKRLFEDGDEEVLLSLTYNASLDKKIALELIKSEVYAKSIAIHIKLDDALFVLLLSKHGADLAKNESLSHDMQEKLLNIHKEDIKMALASNSHIDEAIITELISDGSEDICLEIYKNESTPTQRLIEAYENRLNYFALANNENTPQYILTNLGKSDDAKILMSLAKNIATPVEVLYQLQLDSRFERAVKTNEAFGKHIQTENIGWEL